VSRSLTCRQQSCVIKGLTSVLQVGSQMGSFEHSGRSLATEQKLQQACFEKLGVLGRIVGSNSRVGQRYANCSLRYLLRAGFHVVFFGLRMLSRIDMSAQWSACS
jgi:hypothetical protein